MKELSNHDLKICQKLDTSCLVKKWPEGEPLGKRANLTTLAAPFSTDKMPVFLLMSVLTKPGQTQLMHNLWCL